MSHFPLVTFFRRRSNWVNPHNLVILKRASSSQRFTSSCGRGRSQSLCLSLSSRLSDEFDPRGNGGRSGKEDGAGGPLAFLLRLLVGWSLTTGDSAIKSDVKVNGGIYCFLYVSARSGLMCRHHLLKHALRGVPNIRGVFRKNVFSLKKRVFLHMCQRRPLFLLRLSHTHTHTHTHTQFPLSLSFFLGFFPCHFTFPSLLLFFFLGLFLCFCFMPGTT